MKPQNNRKLIMSKPDNTLPSSAQAQQAKSPTPNARTLECLTQKAYQRGLKTAEPHDIGIEFKIELPDDELEPLPAPKFFITDLVCWKPLPGETDSPECGLVIGMKYWIPSLSEPLSLESANAEWQYLIHLNCKAPSRPWISTDWASESDLAFQETCDSNSPATE